MKNAIIVYFYNGSADWWQFAVIADNEEQGYGSINRASGSLSDKTITVDSFFKINDGHFTGHQYDYPPKEYWADAMKYNKEMMCAAVKELMPDINIVNFISLD